MDDFKTVRTTEVAMMTGRRLSPRQIEAYKDALRRSFDDGYIEVLTLLFAEAMADTYTVDETAAIMRKVKDAQNALTAQVEDGLRIDRLIVRVYDKTGMIFPMSDAEEAHILNVLRDAGYDTEALEA